MIRSVVGIEHLPDALAREHVTIPQALHRTALLTSFAALIDAILRSSRPDQPARGDSLIAVLAQLQAAVLAAALHVASDATGPAALRSRIEAHIQAHHTEPTLTVDRIAAAVGISTRHAHAVFNDGDHTIGRVLRNSRTATAARLLNEDRSGRNLDDLAHRAGFTDRDALNRAIQQRYGMTTTQYRHSRDHI